MLLKVFVSREIGRALTEFNLGPSEGTYEEAKEKLLSKVAAYDLNFIRYIMEMLVKEYAIDCFFEADHSREIELLSLLLDITRQPNDVRGRYPSRNDGSHIIDLLVAFSAKTSLPLFWPKTQDDISCAHHEYVYAKACNAVADFLPTDLIRFHHGDFIDKDAVLRHLANRLLSSFRHPWCGNLLGLLTLGYLQRLDESQGILRGEPTIGKESYLYIDRKMLRQATQKYLFNLAWRAATGGFPEVNVQPVPVSQWVRLAENIVILCAESLPSFASYMNFGDGVKYLQKIIVDSLVFHERQITPRSTKELLHHFQDDGVISLDDNTMSILDALYSDTGLQLTADLVSKIESANDNYPQIIHGEGTLNKDFLLPYDSVHATVHEVALPSFYGSIAQPFPSLSGNGVLEAVLASFRRWQAAQDSFEEFCRRQFSLGGIEVSHGKYLFNNDEAECDGIGIVGDTVYLLEVKWHSINRNSLQGDIAALVYDLGASFLEGSRQTFRTEIAARIALESGEPLLLYHKTTSVNAMRRRDVEPLAKVSIPENPTFVRVVVSADVPIIFHNPVVCHNVLMMFYQQNFLLHPRYRRRNAMIEKFNRLSGEVETFRNYLNYLLPKYRNDLRQATFNSHFITFGMLSEMAKMEHLSTVLKSYAHSQANDYDFASTLAHLKRLSLSSSSNAEGQ